MKINELDATYLNQCRNALTDEQTNSLAETNHWEHVDRAQVHADWGALYQDLAQSIDTSSPSDGLVQALVGQHYEIACRFYTPSRHAYIGMALFYDENPDMKAYHNSFHPQMVEFLGSAICLYAHENL